MESHTQYGRSEKFRILSSSCYLRRIGARLLAILLLTHTAAIAQESEPIRSITLQWGAGTLARQDLIFSPFVHKDFSISNIGLSYQHSGNWYHQVALRYSGFAPSLIGPYEFQEHGETKTALPHQFTYVDLDFVLARRLGSPGPGSVRLGGVLTNEVQVLNYVYGRIASFGYYASLGLSLFGSYTYEFGARHQFSARAQLPLLSWVARSPFAVNDDEFIENTASHKGVRTFLNFVADGQLTSWNQGQQWEFGLSYDYALSPRWSVGLDERLRLVHLKSPRNLLSYQNTVSISLTRKF